MELRPADSVHIDRAIAEALAAEAAGNLPVGAVLAIGEEVVAAAGNALLVPAYDPGRHAEIEAIRRVPRERWPEAAAMTCYTTLEPCVMCMGALLLHGVRRVVFGAVDPTGGAGPVLEHLPAYYERGVMSWVGPVAAARCDPLHARVHARFVGLPCGARE
ncbi:MAG: nucleoside deaminase [Myxococcales bacterium]|nr:nucleoside deaminase [Myxococcales bacterium]